MIRKKPLELILKRLLEEKKTISKEELEQLLKANE